MPANNLNLDAEADEFDLKLASMLLAADSLDAKTLKSQALCSLMVILLGFLRSAKLLVSCSILRSTRFQLLSVKTSACSFKLSQELNGIHVELEHCSMEALLAGGPIISTMKGTIASHWHFMKSAEFVPHLQGTIEETDIGDGEKSFLTVRLHSGYLVPESKHRFVCFHPDTGVMIPQYQIVAEEVEDLGDGLIKVMVVNGKQYGPEFAAAVATGNFICIEVRIQALS